MERAAVGVVLATWAGWMRWQWDGKQHANSSSSSLGQRGGALEPGGAQREWARAERAREVPRRLR